MIQHRIKEREPQYMDMKEIIAEAARKLILEKKVKKLTVKDIVEECQITRQAFYYHFEGIPDMIQWSIKQGTRRLLEACKEQGGAEAALKYLFVFAINAIPEVRKGIESNYGKELEQTLMQGTYELFESIVEEENLYRNYSRQELKLILRYHSHAIFGIFLKCAAPFSCKNISYRKLSRKDIFYFYSQLYSQHVIISSVGNKSWVKEHTNGY